MSYGQAPYGQAPYGGISYDPTGPSLVSTIPVNAATGISVNATIVAVVTSPSTFDPFSVNVLLNGVPAIVASTFLPGYSGTLDFEGVTCTITIAGHPVLPNGLPISASFGITDLSGLTGIFPIVFHTVPGTAPIYETVGVVDSVSVVIGQDMSIVNLGATTIKLTFVQEFKTTFTGDVSRYVFQPTDGGVPLLVSSAVPGYTTKQMGTAGATGAPDANPLLSHELVLDGTFTTANIGDYITLTGPGRSWNQEVMARIEVIVSSNTIRVDVPVLADDPLNGSLMWTHTSAVQTVTLTVNKATNGKHYTLDVGPLLMKLNGPLALSASFVAAVPLPQLSSVAFLPEGNVVVTFGEPMRTDVALTSASEYAITGASAVTVVGVETTADDQVTLYTSGIGYGTYTLTVNASGTPHDVAGNPIDPTFNQAIFQGSPALSARSIFTDGGPIAKAPNVIQFGTQATVVDAMTLNLADGNVSTAMVGLLVTISDGVKNGGTFVITSVPSATRLRVAASFTLFDATVMSWKVFDPQDGEIADDPTDVVVRINGVVTPAESVVGLLGQVVMSAAPAHGSTVTVDYDWVCNPVVDLRRLNSKEFRFNSWNRDLGYLPDASRHKYRYNNVLSTPSHFIPLDERAPLAQPLQRDLKYRAYERAYTALLNDPNTLLFNSPTNHIAFPPLQRPLSPSFINYQATGLPENDPVAPWTRNGTGTAIVASNELVVTSSSAGTPFPLGQPIFWTRPIDLTFQHVLAVSWRMVINADPVKEGVFTGVSAGFSDGAKCIVVGFLDNAGTRMIGVLKAGFGNDPSQLTAWTGGLDSGGNPTNTPATFDWSTLHSYRLYQDQTGNISIFVDGNVVATLIIAEDQTPFLSELNEPFNQLQGMFFGSLSRLATSTSTWDFVRYEILPINPDQIAPSVFASYEADLPPEVSPQPWTPLGSHGTETIPHNGLLILDSTSATNQATEVLAGLVGGDFRGFMRIEPLLSAASSVALDVNVEINTWTHGIAPNAVMVAIDDGNFLIQLSLFPDRALPLFSYGGRSFPDQFVPYTWTKMGGQTPSLVGQLLRIIDASTTDGLLYFIDDNPVPNAPKRVVSSLSDYALEFRCRVVSHTPDPGGFSGVNAEVYDSLRDLGVLLLDVSGTLSVAFHSEGAVVAQFPFNWNDSAFHTYRMVKNSLGNLVSLFIDTVLIGTAAYSSFASPAPTSPVGVTSFGSTTPASQMAVSVVDWAYCNVWRVQAVAHPYAGIWKGFDPNALTGYHLPLKTSGRGARVEGNGIEDLNANFVAAGVVPGDSFIVDYGPNKGVYAIASVTPTVLTVTAQSNPPVLFAASAMAGGSSLAASATAAAHVAASLLGQATASASAVRDTTLVASSSVSAAALVRESAQAVLAGTAAVSATATLVAETPSPSPFPLQPSVVDYRIPSYVDWTMPHRYRIVRDPSGGVALFLDTTVAPIIQLGYNNIDLPSSSVGLPSAIADHLPSITWGAFDPTNLSQTGWQYIRYGITKPSTQADIVPPHQVFNQRNVMASFERHLSALPHTLTDFWSESEGIPPQTAPDFLQNPGLVAYTLLNDGTPLVPSTQTYEVRRPTPILVPVVGFNDIQDLMNSPSFVMNESEQRIELIVPPDVLYDSLQVIEVDTGSSGLIAPFTDECQPYSLGAINYQGVTCLTYQGTILPEQDPSAATPWTFQADDPSHVLRSTGAGILTYGTDSTGTRTIYRNETPLPDAPSLTTQVTFRIKVLNDASSGLGDSQIRVGLSAPGMTLALAFVTTPLGQRYVMVVDQNSGTVVGGLPFDFLDGNYHTYRIVRNPCAGVVQVFIDS